MKTQGLCYRCEYRARYYETGSGPRYECHSQDTCVAGCYMYKPVVPCATVPSNKVDWRPRHGPAMISSREYFDSVPEDMVLNRHTEGDKAVLYWTPKDLPER